MEFKHYHHKCSDFIYNSFQAQMKIVKSQIERRHPGFLEILEIFTVVKYF